MAGLNIDIFNAGYRPVPSAIPVWPDGRQATWPATTSALISGERDGVLVDALVTKGDQLFEKPVVPVALDKPELEDEGHTLHVLKLGQSDVADSTAVHVPDLDTLLPGDVIYNGIHLWM